MSAAANIENTEPVVGAAAPKPTVAKARQSPLVRYPCQVHAAIGLPMARSIERMSSVNSLKRNADILREALHNYLAYCDPEYRRELGLIARNQPHG